MGTFSSGSMHGSGTPGQALTGGTTYTFELQNRKGQGPQTGAQYLILDGSGVATQQAGGEVSFIGPLKDGIIPLSNIINGISGGGINATFIFDVVGDQQGGGAEIALTATLLDGDATATITQATIIKGGENFTDGDGITISLNDIQAAGFTNAQNPVAPFTGGLQMDIFPDKIFSLPQDTTITGSFGGFVNSINQSSLVVGSLGFAFEMPDSGSIGGAFEFTPTITMPQNSYAIRSTGNFELTIAP